MQETRYKGAPPCYCLKVRRASAVITKFYDKILSSCGITVTQFSLLINIAAEEQCSVRELADRTELDRSTLARSLKPLYQQGLVVDIKRQGARNSRLELTQTGQETVECAKKLWTLAQEKVRQTLGEEGISSLEKIFASLETL